MTYTITPTTFTVNQHCVHVVARVEETERRPGYNHPLTACRLDGASYPDAGVTILWLLAGSWSTKLEVGPELDPETPDGMLNLLVALLEAEAPSYWAALEETEEDDDWLETMTYPELEERLREAEGESSACSDPECGCHETAKAIKSEMSDREERSWEEWH